METKIDDVILNFEGIISDFEDEKEARYLSRMIKFSKEEALLFKAFLTYLKAKGVESLYILSVLFDNIYEINVEDNMADVKRGRRFLLIKARFDNSKKTKIFLVFKTRTDARMQTFTLVGAAVNEAWFTAAIRCKILFPKEAYDKIKDFSEFYFDNFMRRSEFKAALPSGDTFYVYEI
jgi:hypothetical protein